jgi:hypothetical protein
MSNPEAVLKKVFSRYDKEKYPVMNKTHQFEDGAKECLTV